MLINAHNVTSSAGHPDPVFVFYAEEIEKRLTAYRKGSKIWRMLIFCQVRENKANKLKHDDKKEDCKCTRVNQQCL